MDPHNVPTDPAPSPDAPRVGLTHWVGEHNNTLHGNGAHALGLTSGDEDEVTCRLCHTLLARLHEGRE
jgi:hypothetical protein